eukprot:7379473-Pyramimonas_sp.AAC.1
MESTFPWDTHHLPARAEASHPLGQTPTPCSQYEATVHIVEERLNVPLVRVRVTNPSPPSPVVRAHVHVVKLINNGENVVHSMMTT